MRGADARSAIFQLSRQRDARTRSQVRIDVPEPRPLGFQKFGWTMHRVPEEHSSFVSGGNEHHRTSRSVTWCRNQVDTGRQREIAVPQPYIRLEPTGDFRLLAIPSHEEFPILGVAVDRRIREGQPLVLPAPADVIAVQMRQQDVADLRRLDAERLEAVEKGAAPEQALGLRPDAE